MIEYPKHIKRQLRELSAMAHEEELRRALVPLSESFDQWKQGGVESGDMAVRIHKFDRGPARKLFSRYNDGFLELNVAMAIADGVLDRSKVPQEVHEALGPIIAMIDRNRIAAKEDPDDEDERDID